MVLVDQPDEVPQPEPPPSVPARNVLEEIMMKYGLKREDRPPVVVATPVVNLSGSRKKSFARKGANKSAATSEPTVSEEEVPIDQPEEASETQSSTQAPHVPPPLVEVKLEVEDMTADEFERYGWTDRITFGQLACLDVERANAKHPHVKEKGKRKGKGKSREVEDSDYPVWNVKIKVIHYPNGESIPISDIGEFAGITEVEDLKRAIDESIESERLGREKAEAELQEMIAQIDQSEKDAQLAKLQEECE